MLGRCGTVDLCPVADSETDEVSDVVQSWSLQDDRVAEPLHRGRAHSSSQWPPRSRLR